MDISNTSKPESTCFENPHKNSHLNTQVQILELKNEIIKRLQFAQKIQIQQKISLNAFNKPGRNRSSEIIGLLKQLPEQSDNKSRILSNIFLFMKKFEEFLTKKLVSQKFIVHLRKSFVESVVKFSWNFNCYKSLPILEN